MTHTETTTALFQQKAQQQLDHALSARATEAIEDYASRLNRMAVSVMNLHAQFADAVGGTLRAVATIAQHHNEHAWAIMMLGGEAKR